MRTREPGIQFVLLALVALLLVLMYALPILSHDAGPSAGGIRSGSGMSEVPVSYRLNEAGRDR